MGREVSLMRMSPIGQIPASEDVAVKYRSRSRAPRRRRSRSRRRRPAQLARELAAHVAQWRSKTKPKARGQLEITSGALALMLPYRDGAFTDADEDRLRLPLPNGTYKLWEQPFGPTPAYEDEVGWYGSCYRLLRS